MTAVATVVLTDRVDRSRVDAFAHAQGWTPTGSTPRGHWVMASRTWRTPEGVEVTHYEDHVGELRYVRLHGAAAEAVAERIRSDLPHESIDEVLTWFGADATIDECIRGLGHLAVQAPAEPDPRYVEIWGRMLGHDDKAIRRAAIRTAYGLPWPAIEELARTQLQRRGPLAPQLEDLLAFLERTP